MNETPELLLLGSNIEKCFSKLNCIRYTGIRSAEFLRFQHPKGVIHMGIIEISNANFTKEVIESDRKVLVDFWAPWCGPCRMVSPIVDEIAVQSAEVKVCKINIDEQPQLASQYGVMSIPTLMVFEHGEPVQTVVGARNKAFILQMLEG
jgi:thioredoxin 1